MDQETRIYLWEAFSEFFLDTEISEYQFRNAAQAITQSGISLAEDEVVLWNEVFPVLHVNLQSVAGVWAGWPREWLITNLRPATGPARRTGPRSLVQEIERCWVEVLKHIGSHT